MKNAFQVRVLSFSILQEIEGTRTSGDFTAMLDAMEFGDIAGMSDDELREVCVMSLQDRSPQEAAAVVLKHDLGDELREGQIRNMASEMLDEKLWEHYADMALHERLFNVGSLLYEAFPQMFPEPDAVRVTLEVVAANEAARETLADPLHESLVVRLIADGTDENSILHRLFDEQLAGQKFPEADMIVWIVRTEPTADHTMKIEVISSGYWLDALRETSAYESGAYADGEP